MTAANQRYTNADNTVSAYKAVALTESDSATFDTTRGIYVGTSGDLVVTMNDGTDHTFYGVLGGMVYPFQIIALKTATTAGNVDGLY